MSALNVLYVFLSVLDRFVCLTTIAVTVYTVAYTLVHWVRLLLNHKSGQVILVIAMFRYAKLY